MPQKTLAWHSSFPLILLFLLFPILYSRFLSEHVWGLISYHTEKHLTLCSPPAPFLVGWTDGTQRHQASLRGASSQKNSNFDDSTGHCLGSCLLLGSALNEGGGQKNRKHFAILSQYTHFHLAGTYSWGIFSKSNRVLLAMYPAYLLPSCESWLQCNPRATQ